MQKANRSLADASATSTGNGVPHLRRVLSLKDLIIFGIMAVTPSAPVTVFGLVSVRARGHTVDTILFAMVAMVLTVVSYGRMASLYPAAGSAYTYVGRGINPHRGFLAGWAMLLDYLTIPIFCVVYGSLIVHRMIPKVPYVIISACFAGGITWLNVRGIRATARTNHILLAFMGVVLLSFIVLAVRYLWWHQGPSGLFSTAPFYNPCEFHVGAVIHATSFAALTYIGFDSVTTLAEDVRNPRRNVLLALVIVCLFTGIFGGLITYLGQRVWPDFRTFPDIATAFMDVTRRVGGFWLSEAMVLLLAIANLGAGLTGFRGYEGLTAYSVSKGGIAALTRAMAADYSRHHIRVNAIVPGCMDTPMNAARLSDDAMRRCPIAMTPYGRLGTMEDVAGLALFLASDEADFCVGGFYAIDGGLMAI